MSNKKFIINLIFLLIIISIAFFLNYGYKIGKFGNNIASTTEGVVENILNISSYRSIAEITVISNKNESKYKIKQAYKINDCFYQEVLEPENIEGIKMSYKNKSLSIENTKLNLSKIYDNYEVLTENHLCLSSFINTYKNDENADFFEIDEEIIMKAKIKEPVNKYLTYKQLYIDKKTQKPTKLEVKDINEKTLVYIKYIEIELNCEDVFAFEIKSIDEGI